MGKVWMRCDPYRRPDGRWVPQLRLLEETGSGAVEDVRVLTGADVDLATEEDARAWSAELGRHWLRWVSRSQLNGYAEHDD